MQRKASARREAIDDVQQEPLTTVVAFIDLELKVTTFVALPLAMVNDAPIMAKNAQGMSPRRTFMSTPSRTRGG
jgi:hypothetical protein